MRSINRPVAFGVLIVLAVIAVAAAALAPAAFAGAEYDRATGGGQIMTPSGNGGGPGDTLAFNAQNTGTNDAARGQLQYVQHSPASPSHGVIQCLTVSANGTMADMAGTWSSGALAGTTQTPTFFELKLTDNGQGSGSNDDFICFDSDANNNQCDGEAGTGTTLGRGNAQIYNAP